MQKILILTSNDTWYLKYTAMYICLIYTSIYTKVFEVIQEDMRHLRLSFDIVWQWKNFYPGGQAVKGFRFEREGSRSSSSYPLIVSPDSFSSLWLLVGTPSVLGPELVSRRAEHSHSCGCLYIYLIYCFYHLPCLCNNFYGLSALVGFYKDDYLQFLNVYHFHYTAFAVSGKVGIS